MILRSYQRIDVHYYASLSVLVGRHSSRHGLFLLETEEKEEKLQYSIPEGYKWRSWQTTIVPTKEKTVHWIHLAVLYLVLGLLDVVSIFNEQ